MRIHLPQPCHENWHSMSPNEQGRHCQQCNKVVHDFTSYSDAELLAFFKNEQGACGRFKSSQIGRHLYDRSPYNLKWAIAACSLLLLTHTELEAQNAVVATDDSVAVTEVTTQTQMIRVVRLTIHQADTMADQITRIRMRHGNFSIETDIDSSNAVSISIPSTEEAGTVADFELYNHSGDTIVLLDVAIGNGELRFSHNNGRWTANSLGQEFLITNFRYPVYSRMTLGFSVPLTLFEPESVVTDFRHEPLQTFYLGSPAINNQADTLPLDTLASKRAIIKAKHSKEHTGISQVWWAGIIGGIGLILAWFWQRKRKA